MTKVRANQTEVEEILNDPAAFATETRRGTLEIATQAEVDAKTDTLRVVTPNTLSNAIITQGGVLYEPFDATILKSADIGVTVQAFDATILVDADIGVTISDIAHNHNGVYEPIDATILRNVIEDTTPQLGGNLDANGFNISGIIPTLNEHLTRKDYVDDTTVSLTGDTMTGTLEINGDLTLSDVHPELTFIEIDAPIDNKRWDILSSGEELSIRAINDANTASGTALAIQRTGTTIDDVSITSPSSPTTPTAAEDLTRKDYVDGTTVSLTGDTMTGALTLEASTPTINLRNTAATADNGRWDIIAPGESLRLRAINDAGDATGDVLIASRTGTTIDDVSITSPSSPTTPTASEDLTRKDYVDLIDTRLDLSGIGAIRDLRGTIYVTGLPQDIFSTGTVFGFAPGGADGLNIPGMGATSDYGILQSQGQWADGSGLEAAALQIFTNGNGSFQRVRINDTTWSAWVQGASVAYVDTNFLGISAKAADSDLLDGLDATDFNKSGLGAYGFDTTLNNASVPIGISRIYQTSVDSPDGSWNNAILFKQNTTRGFQIALGDGDEDLYFRNQVSDGASWQPWRKVWSDNNDGSGSGLDADLLDGANLNTSSLASTVVQRDGSGDINTRLFRSEYDITNASIGLIMTQVDTATNNYIRPSTLAQVRTSLNVENGATADQTASEILTAIKTVDGIGSGLDAELLQGAGLEPITLINSTSKIPSSAAVFAKVGGLNTKAIDIGIWNMLSTTSVAVAHGLDFTKIQNVQANILKDGAGSGVNFNTINGSETTVHGISWDATTVILNRGSAGIFDNTGYDSTTDPANRGWITIQYTD